MNTESNRNLIAKNTLFLYIRMLFTMTVSLYTSRVILDKIGVDDYGIYQAVGGIVGLITFIKGALSTGASRFITYALGEKEHNKLKTTFSTILFIHVFFAVIIVIITETLGLWFVNNKMVIPPERMDAAIFAFHISVIGIVFTLLEVPFSAMVIAHEKMSFYAYTSIYDVCAKLGICYLLSIDVYDKLKLYAFLHLLIQISLLFIYYIYCCKNFKECRISLKYDKKILKEVLGFSGWSLFANGALALNNQGILVLINLFFSPAIVAARSVSTQVYMGATQFVNSFRTAVNPQIVKKLASGDEQGSHRLLLLSTRYSFFLMLMLCLPLILLADPILHIWLKEVPDYTVFFIKIILVQSLFQVFDTSFYTALYAMGRLRENALFSPAILFLQFPIIYILFKLGFSPNVLAWANLFSVMILALVVKPMLITYVAGYLWTDIWKVFKSCIIVTLVSIPVPIIVSHIANIGTFVGFTVVACVCVISVGLSVWFLGIERNHRIVAYNYIKTKITKI